MRSWLVTGLSLAAVIVLAIGALAAAALAPAERRLWIAGGIPYAGALGLAPIVLRSDGEYGFLAVIFLFVVVWTTDIAAYFVGRAVGGPKLLPRVSPNKTWSGAIGGRSAPSSWRWPSPRRRRFAGLFAIAMLAIVLSVSAQAGDLFESALKRGSGPRIRAISFPDMAG